jgi:tRNA/rRNA methyltransferase
MLKPFFTYMLRCADGSYYLGHTDEIEKRIAEHQHGQGCAWTKSRLPVELVWRQEFPDRDAARAAEHQIKRWTRAKKEALIAGDFDRLQPLAGRSQLSRAVAFTFAHPMCLFCTPSSELDSVHKRPRRLKSTSAASPTRDLTIPGVFFS